MTATLPRQTVSAGIADSTFGASGYGPLGHVGSWTSRHARAVFDRVAPHRHHARILCHQGTRCARGIRVSPRAIHDQREYWQRSDDPKEPMIGGLAPSGRTIFAAGAVMVAVFFTLALAAPLPLNEMGVVLPLTVLFAAALLRLILLPVFQRLAGRHASACPRWQRWTLPSITFGH